MDNLKVLLKDGDNQLFPIPDLIGVDVNNIIATLSSNEYTALEDCCCLTIRGGTDISSVLIDNVEVARLGGNGTGSLFGGGQLFFLKKKKIKIYV